MNQFAVVIHVCDAYRILFQGFNYFFQKYWNFEIPCQYYFLSEELDVDFPQFKNIKSGPGEWSDRLKVGLKQIPEQNILYFQEDFWLKKPVCKRFITEAFELFIEKEMHLLKLHGCLDYKTIATDVFLQGHQLGEFDKKKSKYHLSHQVSIWQKDFFIKNLYANENPWQNEKRGSKRIKKDKLARIFHLDYFINNDNPVHNKNQANISLSEYNGVSDRSCFNQASRKYFDELCKADDQQIIKYGRTIKEHFAKNLSHKDYQYLS